MLIGKLLEKYLELYLNIGSGLIFYNPVTYIELIHKIQSCVKQQILFTLIFFKILQNIHLQEHVFPHTIRFLTVILIICL